MASIFLWMPFSVTSSTSALQPRDTSGAREASAFFDGLISDQMEAHHVPGAVAAMVQDGRLVFARGYGYANTAEDKPVVADRTLFRLASISKLFVWTAVMQLVEEGKLDLDADVNVYLPDFQIPYSYPEPITLLHLMNHTAGFEERSLGTSARRPQDIQPLGEYLARNMPARVRPPGEVTAYSNYGTALAGYIVGQVAQMPFEAYVEEHIFEPLEMGRSTMRQPLPATLASHLASGHTYTDGVYEPKGVEWAQLAPAAGLSATATDMANFMIAHLQQGRFGDRRILQERTATRMQQQSFTNDPRVSGYAHGFAEATINGQRLLGHGGDMLYFHSALYLLPEQNSGFFVAFNGANGFAAVLNTREAVVDQFFSGQAPALVDVTDDKVGRYAGVYFPTRAEYTTAGKMVSLIQGISVTANGAQQLEIALGFPAQATGQYTAIAPGVFRTREGSISTFGDVVFSSDSEGRRYLFAQNEPSTAYVRVPWYAAPSFNLALLGAVVLSFLSVLLWAPSGWWIGRRRRETVARSLQLASWWQRLLSLAGLLFLAGFAVIFSNPEVVFGLSTGARAVFLLPGLIAVLAMGTVGFTLVAWTRSWWRFWGRVHYTVVAFLALAFVWWLARWNLWIGFLR